MKSKFIFLLFSLYILFIQCKKNADSEDKYIAPVFSETKEIIGKKMNSSFIFDFGRINHLDTMIISSGKTDINDYVFHLFSKTSGKYIKSFGTIGQGPGEITLPISGFSTDIKNNKIYCYDARQHKLVEYFIYTNNDEIIVASNDDVFPPQIQNASGERVFSLRENEFLTAYNGSIDASYRFIKTSFEDTISTYNQYPRLSEPEEFIRVEYSYFSYFGTIAVKPNGKKFVHATRSGCILEIFDCSEEIKPLKTKRFFEPSYKPPKRKDTRFPLVQKGDNSINGITNIFCTDKYIYATYSDSRGENNYNQIAVFDWNGDPVKLLLFSDSIISFVVENNDEKGYALVRDSNEDFCLIDFDIN